MKGYGWTVKYNNEVITFLYFYYHVLCRSYLGSMLRT